MVITNLEEKENKKFFVPIRPGNRGGWDQFRWENVREMPYKSREMYLGNSAMIGVLDKGGKWRKKDWYTKTDKKYTNASTEEMNEAIRRDQERMKAALGECEEQEAQQKLTEQEMKELLKKVKRKDEEEYPEPTPDKMIGLGFDKTKVQIRAKPGISKYNPHRIEGNTPEQNSPQTKRKHKKQKKQKHERKQKKHKKEHKSKSHREGEKDRERSRDKKSKKHRRIGSDDE